MRSLSATIARIDAEVSYAGPDRTISGGGLPLPDPCYVGDRGRGIPGRLEAFERQTGGPLKGDMRHKSHLLFAWLAELVRCRSILDAVEDLHGLDLLCWNVKIRLDEIEAF